jgi:2-hydroxychromene-2-carboxylate isomerase
MKTVDFYFDFSSPFAYLASTQIEGVAARHGAVVRYRPFLLGALFKAIGTPDVPIFAMPEAKRKHYAADVFRWADHYGAPFHFPSRFPMNTIKPLRMVLAAAEADRPRLIARIYEAYWSLDRDISDDATLGEITGAAGFDAAALLAATRDERIKAELKAATDHAIQIGVCGAPTFVVDGRMFWGQDRLHFVEKALDGWIPRSEMQG